MSRDRNWFFGRHFVIDYPIFDFFFAVFWFFWITLSVAHISLPNSFGKVLFWVTIHRDPPLTTNGSAEGLDHLSVKTPHFEQALYNMWETESTRKKMHFHNIFCRWFSSVASLTVRRGKVKEPSRFLLFLPDFFSFFTIFPDFFPLFPDFWQIFRCQGWHSTPLAPTVATWLWLPL